MCFHHIVNYIESFAQSPHHYFLAVWKTSHLSLTFFALTIPNAQKTTISQKIKRNWATLESVKVEFSALCYMLLCLFAFFFREKTETTYWQRNSFQNRAVSIYNNVWQRSSRARDMGSWLRVQLWTARRRSLDSARGSAQRWKKVKRALEWLAGRVETWLDLMALVVWV